MSPTNERTWTIIRWAARVLSLLPIIFLLGEFVSPHVDENVFVPWTDYFLLSLMTLSVIGLIAAWRWERIGGWLSLGSLAAFLILYWVIRGEFFPWIGLVPLGFIALPAILFLLCCRHTRQLQLGMA